MGAAKDLIAKAKAKSSVEVFDEKTKAELKELVLHNHAARKRDRVTADVAMQALGIKMARCTFDQAVKRAFGVTFGGQK